MSETTGAKRRFDPLQILRQASNGRLRQLLAIKYARMSVSPFAFFRGAVAIMAADLAALPHSGLNVQLCGDAHVENLGSFAGPDGRLVFDINDFDETIAGPWEWDVKRMATSIVLAGRESKHKTSACLKSVEAFCNAYAGTLAHLARLPHVDVARYRIHRTPDNTPISAALAQSERARPIDLLKKYTVKAAKGSSRFRTLKPTFWRVEDSQTRKAVLNSLTAYRASLSQEHRHLFHFYKPVDVAFKIVGTGSVGLRDYVVLLAGNGIKDPLFLQIKQEVSSIYHSYLHGHEYENEGMRVAFGQRQMQPLSDLLLGWTRIGSHDYLVRHLNDHKGSIDIANLNGEGLFDLAIIAGELLARGHARSGDCQALRGYVGSGKKTCTALAAFAAEYADQTEQDYDRFMDAVKKGTIHVAKRY
jgi:uncharacterized protein (DUF2252 family)